MTASSCPEAPCKKPDYEDRGLRGRRVLISTLGMNTQGTVVQALYGLCELREAGRKLEVDAVDQIATKQTLSSAWCRHSGAEFARIPPAVRDSDLGKYIETRLANAACLYLDDITDLVDRGNWSRALAAILQHVEQRRRQVGPAGQLIFDITGGRVGLSKILDFAAQLCAQRGDLVVYTNVTDPKGYLTRKDAVPRTQQPPPAASLETTTYIPKQSQDIFYVETDPARLGFFQTMAAWDEAPNASQDLAQLATGQQFERNLDQLENYTLLGIFAAGVVHGAGGMVEEIIRAAESEEGTGGPGEARVRAADLSRVHSLLKSFDLLRRLEEDRAMPAGEPTALLDLVRREVAWQERRLGRGVVEFQVQVHDELRVRVDPHIFSQLLTLLLQNAAAATRTDEGRRLVRVRAEALGSRWVGLGIANSGEPFPQNLAEYAFRAAKPLSIARAMRSSPAGAEDGEKRRGIGLAVAYQLARALASSHGLPRDEKNNVQKPLRIEKLESDLGGAELLLLLPV